MGIGYRSFLSADAGEPLIETVVTQMALWMQAKGVETPVRQAGRYVNRYNDIISVLHEDLGDRRVFRWRREHPEADAVSQMWRTSVTAAEYPDHPGWIWTEIELSEAGRANPYGHLGFMSVPGFLRVLMGELRFCDGRTQMSAVPQWVSMDGLPDLMDCLADESRRGAVLVASPTARSDGDLYEWAVKASWELVGLGVMFLLARDAEAAFNEMVGGRHAVAPGTVRTYAPGVDLDGATDPARHRTLSRERIDISPPKRIAHILGFAQRHRAADLSLPAEVAEVDHILDALAKKQAERPGRGVIRLVQPSADATPQRAAVPNQRERAMAWTRHTPAEQEVQVEAPGQVVDLPSARRSEPAVTVEELRSENARLRRERELLTLMVRNYQRFEASVVDNLGALNAAAESSDDDLEDSPSPGRPHLNGL